MASDGKQLKPHHFKPGKSGNPKGRPKDVIPNALKKLTRQSYARVIKAIVKGNIENLQTIMKDPKSSVLEVGICSAAIKAIQKGDYHTIEQIVIRVIGKVPDKLIVKSTSSNFNVNAKKVEVKKEAVKAVLAEIEAEI